MEFLEDIFSTWLIKSVPDIHTAICSDIIKNNSRKIKTIPSLKYWLKCYRNSKSIFSNTVLSILSTNDNAHVFLEQLYFHLLPQKYKENIIADAINDVKLYSKEEKIEFQSRLLEYKKSFKRESDALLNENYDKIPRDEVYSFISDSDFQFFSRIIIPCLFLYGKFPSQLLRNARLGDEKSIKKLAQIDHSIIHDRKISDYLHTLSFRNPTKHKFLTRVLVKDHPKPKSKDLKIDVAALIALFNALFSKALKTKKMTAPQIRRLFVNEANLHGLNDDPDLPVAETLYKSIKRNTMWNDLLKNPDKN